MAKRFTDSGKWEDPWFRPLPMFYKLAWIFLLDRCNHAGVWKVDISLLNFFVGSKVDGEQLLRELKGRVYPYGDDKWFIPGFVKFQYGKLNPANRAHKSAIAILKSEGLWKVYENYLAEHDLPLFEASTTANGSEKVRYGEYVELFPDQYNKLIQQHGVTKIAMIIGIIDAHVPNMERPPYKDYLAVINKWGFSAYNERMQNYRPVAGGLAPNNETIIAVADGKKPGFRTDQGTVYHWVKGEYVINPHVYWDEEDQRYKNQE